MADLRVSKTGHWKKSAHMRPLPLDRFSKKNASKLLVFKDFIAKPRFFKDLAGFPSKSLIPKDQISGGNSCNPS
jgi:hypothetical protein